MIEPKMIEPKLVEPTQEQIDFLLGITPTTKIRRRKE
jgi:hypothetical protein